VGLGVLVGGFLAFDLTVTNESEHASQRRLDEEIRRALPTTLARALRQDPSTSRSHLVPGPSLGPERPGAWLGVISIPSISLRQVVVEGTGREQLALGPGHYSETAALGSRGNAAIAGHRTTFGGPFLHLDQLHRGEDIIVTTPHGAYRYAVSRVEVVAPTDVDVLAPSSGPTLTLTTCTPAFSATSRLVVVARLASSSMFHSTHVTRVAAPPMAPSMLIEPESWWAPVGYAAALALIGAAAGVALGRTRHRATVVVGAAALGLPLLFLLYGALALEMPGSW
jgi:sortase A